MPFSVRVLFIVVWISILGCHEKRKSNTAGISTDALFEKADNPQIGIDERIAFALDADSIALQNNSVRDHLKSLMLAATLYLQKREYLLARRYFEQAVAVSRSLGDKESLAMSLNNVGIIFNERSEYDSALYYYKEAQIIFNSIGKKDWEAQVWVNLGIVHKNQGNFEKAFEFDLEAVKLLESLANRSALASVYMNIGNVLKELSRLDESLNYHQMALQILYDERDSVGIASALNNIGNVYRYMRNYEKALNNYNSALEIKEKRGNVKSIATTLDNIAQVYFELKDYDKAEDQFKRAIDLRIASGDKDGFITTSNRLCRLYLAKNEIERARIIALKVLNQSPASGFLKQRLENSLILFEIYRKSGNDKLALKYADISHELKDSLFNAQMTENISRMKVEYETDKKEKENVLLKKENIIAEVKFSNQRNQKVIWIISSVFILSVSYLLFYFWRKKKIIRFEHQMSKVKLEALNAQMSDHFISNAMDSINNFIELNEKQKASEYLLLFNRLIRKVLENSFKNLITLREDIEVLKIYLELEKLRFPKSALLCEISVDPDIDADAMLIPPMIFQVLAENAIKHGFKKLVGGILRVSVVGDGNLVKCAVEDNGCGRSYSMNARPVVNEGRVSFGGSLAEKLVKTVSRSGAHVSYRVVDLFDSNDLPTGTRVEFVLPYLSQD